MINSNTQCQYGCSSSNCAVCSNAGGSFTCTSCLSGYTLKQQVCLQCANPSICTSCTPTNTSNCLTCIIGYYISGAACVSCPSGCDVCSIVNNSVVCTTYSVSQGVQTLMYNSTTSFPYICDIGCSVCSTNFPGQCLQCSVTYYAYQNSNGYFQCLPCPSNCATCYTANINGTNQLTCTTCINNAVLVVTGPNSPQVCNLCNPSLNCLACGSNINSCTVCPYGYFLNGSSTGSTSNCLAPCPANCLTCTKNYCTSCQNGYSLTSVGTCLPCINNCRVCSGQLQNVCLECGPGFYLSSTFTCLSCVGGCSKCSQNGCTQCFSGFSLSVSNNNQTTCVPICTFPCASCIPNNPTQCTSCIYGFKISSATCVIADCPATLPQYTCEYCPLGQILANNGNCLTCTSANCFRCSPTNTSICTTCSFGYYLNPGNSQCSQCPSGCLTCNTNSFCSSCQIGFILVASTLSQSLSSAQSTCIACQAPCAQCFGTPQTCVTCI